MVRVGHSTDYQAEAEHEESADGVERRTSVTPMAIAESVIAQLKNISQVEHFRHRSPVNCLVNLVCRLMTVGNQPKKPSLLIDTALPPSAQPELTLTNLQL